MLRGIQKMVEYQRALRVDEMNVDLPTCVGSLSIRCGTQVTTTPANLFGLGGAGSWRSHWASVGVLIGSSLLLVETITGWSDNVFAI